MNRIVLLITSLWASVAFSQSTSIMASSQQKNYQPPAFTDPNRLAKIEATYSAIDKIYQEYAAKNHYPGLAYGLVVDGKLVHSGGLGFTDVARKTPATPKSVFRIASMTKSITAMAILKLRDEGKLQLDDPASKYIPEAANLTYLTADAPAITVRNLMAHSAGFPEDNPWGDRQLADSDAELLAFLKKDISFSNVPGVAYEYSNMGFAMLGRIITKASGKQYQQYITDAILKPLGMTHTEWEYTKVPADQLAHGYRWLDNQWVEEPLLHDGSYGAMGGLITSIEDFSRYVAFHQSAWPARNEAETGPIKRSSVREMHMPRTFRDLSPTFRFPSGRVSPMVTHYAYGLTWSRDADGREYVAHSGGLPGFGSQWRILPDYGIGIIAYGNLTYANLGTVNWAVLDTLISMAKLQPRQLPVSPILKQRKAELVRLLPNWTNAEKSPIFAENFFPDHSLENRRKAAQALFEKIGKVVRVGEVVPENQLRGRFLIEGEQGNVDVFFTLTPENPALIQQLDLNERVKK
ncbi:serine hydrolase domain-containing protein [Spirosoma agri]|uniref:Beta-lactamase family protein n=1 Tax=Spirosoma agri TaxID=1987381 RepID=A0A6M0INH2_9BACT|nr:serine hydrolase domain-containing protein [Spirosoma agri]NEU69507.1 beta-lactamase family protein [Spirosoma agri]